MVRQDKQVQSALTLVGFVDSGLDGPGFVSAAFRDDEGKYYLSNTAENRVSIASFVRADIYDNEIIQAKNDLPVEYRAGDSDVFGFRGLNGLIEAGPRPFLIGRLHKQFKHLRRYPFTQLEVAGFLNSPKLLSAAVRGAAGVETVAYGGGAVRIVDEIAQKFGLDLDYARDLLALDFANALCSYYRLFHRLISVSDDDLRRNLSYRFRTATQNIIPFLLDHSFFEAVIDRERKSQQLYLPSTALGALPPHFELEKMLRRLGVSGKVANRYVERTLAADGKVYEITSPSASEAAAAISSIKTLAFRRKYIDFAVSRLNKKRIKGELDSEFRDLTFGIAIILAHELRALNLDAEEYMLVKAALNRSVRRFGEYENLPQKQRERYRPAKHRSKAVA